MGAYDFQVFSADGNLVDLGKYRGHVTLIVNTSCFDEKARSSYQLLATVHQKYKDEDLSVLLFPCSQFGSGQTTAEIEADYLQKTNLTNAGTLFKEVDVNGANTIDLFTYLKAKKRGAPGGFIKCNFTIFVVDRQGNVVERLTNNVNPNILEEVLVKNI